MHLMADIATTP